MYAQGIDALGQLYTIDILKEISSRHIYRYNIRPAFPQSSNPLNPTFSCIESLNSEGFSAESLCGLLSHQ